MHSAYTQPIARLQALVVAIALVGLTADASALDRGLRLDPVALRDAPAPTPGESTVYAATPHRLVMPDGTALPLRRWGPAPEAGQAPDAVVLGLHGFNDHAGAFIATARALSAAGMAVYAYDQRGFGGSDQRGDWPGAGQLVSDARWALTQLRHRYPDTPIHLVGLSMGGAVASLLMDRSPAPKVDSAVLVAPAFWGRGVMPWYQRFALWAGEQVAPDLTLSSETLDIEPTDDPAVMQALGDDPRWIRAPSVDAMAGVADLMDRALRALPRFDGPPTLIQYGGMDEVIPAEAACAMFSALPAGAPWRAAFYPDGYHMLTRYSGSAAVMSDIRVFLTDSGSVLPSGRGIGQTAARQAVCDD
ncbi:alpha/beta hydrolase [Spiribacter insolitus]|uniref:Lysophospholipase n=1 Tax=Spiribacter insolitus TaxID=3122417 RepID=A0ABV3T558_9GAMM